MEDMYRSNIQKAWEEFIGKDQFGKPIRKREFFFKKKLCSRCNKMFIKDYRTQIYCNKCKIPYGAVMKARWAKK